MKILFVIGDLSGGGAEKILVLLANHFSKKHEVTIATLAKKTIFYNIDSNVNVVELDLYSTSRTFFDAFKNNIKRVVTIRKIIQKEKPDVVISFLTQTNVLVLLSSTFLKVPVIVAEHSVFDALKERFWRVLRRVSYPLAKKLILLTKDELRNYSFVKQKVVIPNFIECLNERDLFSNKESILLAVGRLHPVKRFDILIKMFHKIDIDGWRLYIVGDGKERKKLEKLIEKLQLHKKVYLTGQVKDVGSYYEKAKIVVLTSQYEAFSNVLLEAMCQGCGVVSFDCDYGPRNIIENGKSGYLVQNEEEFIEKVQLLMQNEALCKSIAENGWQEVKKFSKDRIIKQWENVIEDVTNKKRSYC